MACPGDYSINIVTYRENLKKKKKKKIEGLGFSYFVSGGTTKTFFKL